MYKSDISTVIPSGREATVAAYIAYLPNGETNILRKKWKKVNQKGEGESGPKERERERNFANFLYEQKIFFVNFVMVLPVHPETGPKRRS